MDFFPESKRGDKMKKRKKIAMALILIVALILTIVSCQEPKQKQKIEEPEHEHTFGEPVESGNTITYTCTECGYEKKHTHKGKTSWSSDNKYHWHEAACEHTDVVLDKEEHDWNEMDSLPPTCEQNGILTKQCKVCGSVIAEVLPATGHQPGTNYTIENGIKYSRCTVCGEMVIVGTEA